VISGNVVTSITIFGGLALSVILYVLTGRISKKWTLGSDILFGFLANSMTLATIGCFVWNLGFLVLTRAISPANAQDPTAPTTPLASMIDFTGNEATAFFALFYAFGMIAAAVRRNLLTACGKTH
jgi:hypothetical protein